MKVVGKKTAHLVASQIVRDITAEDLQKLPSEAELMERYEVSRPSLREALRVLETYGVISVRPGPGGGARVDPRASDQFSTASTLYFHLLGLTLRDVMNTRLRLEPFMARTAAQRVAGGTPWNNGADTSGNEGPNPDPSYHFTVARFAGDPILLMFADALRHIHVDQSGADSIQAKLAEKIDVKHEEITEAIAAGDPDRAEELMSEHISQYLDLLESQYPHLLDEVIEWG